MFTKLLFIGFAGLIALPSFAPSQVRLETQPVSAFSASGEAYDDRFNPISFSMGLIEHATNLCERQPEVCVEGIRLTEAAVRRAQHGARIAYAMVIDHRNEIRLQSETSED